MECLTLRSLFDKTAEFADKKVTVGGWVRSNRDSKSFGFLVISDSTFFTPVQVFIASIPGCVFGGASIILYGYIACSGVRMLQQVDLNKPRNLILVSAVLSLGISGLAIGGPEFAISGTALALVFGVVLNLFLKEKKE